MGSLRRPVNIHGLEDKYTITTHGVIFSRYKQRLLKPVTNNAGYKQYFLTPPNNGKGKWYKAHYLVMMTFGKPKPGEDHEINHKDCDKNNNHITNLEWITHKENIRHARANKQWKTGRKPGFKHNEETKEKMRRAKQKPVTIINTINGDILKANSIQEAADKLNTNRETIQRKLNTSKKYKEYLFVSTHLAENYHIPTNK
jgi:hypothetical protein